MDPKKIFPQAPRDVAYYDMIARKLMEDIDLVTRYRAAIDQLPPDKELFELDPEDKSVRDAYAVLREIDEAIRNIESEISNNDRAEAGVRFASLVFKK